MFYVYARPSEAATNLYFSQSRWSRDQSSPVAQALDFAFRGKEDRSDSLSGRSDQNCSLSPSSAGCLLSLMVVSCLLRYSVYPKFIAESDLSYLDISDPFFWESTSLMSEAMSAHYQTSLTYLLSPSLGRAPEASGIDVQ